MRRDVVASYRFGRMLGSLVLLSAVVAAGVGLTYWLPVRLRWEERVAAGAVVGIVSFCAVAFAMFELAGMGWATVLVGAGAPAGGGAWGWWRRRGDCRAERASAVARLRLPMRAAASLRPFAVFTVAAGAVATRTLSLAYQATAQGVAVGNLAVYGDWSAHLAYAGSFAYGDNRALQSPLASGTPLRYHFLCDFFAAPFTVTGATLQQSLTLTAWVLAVVLTPLLLFAVQRLTGSRLTSILAVLLFTLSGGAGVWYFLVDVQHQGWGILTELPRTYARIPEQHIFVDNTISMSLYAQRSTQMGLCIGLAALVLLLAGRVTWRRPVFVVAGVLVAVTGITYVHLLLTALALGTLAAWAERRSGRWREWLWFLAPAAVVGLPLVAAIQPPSSALRWLVGWMAVDAHQSWPWFWLRNAGLFLPLFALAATTRVATPRLRRLTLPLWAWFVVPNLVAFHPWAGNNAKFFLFWQLAGAIVLADVLGRAYARRVRWRGMAVQAVALAAVLGLVATGGLDTLRGMQRSSAMPWAAADDVSLALWLRDHAQAGDVLAHGGAHDSAVAALGGVAVVGAYGGWIYDLGLPDWYQRGLDSAEILAGGEGASALVQRYGVDWVAIGPVDRETRAASDEYWSEHGELAAEAGQYRLYRVRKP